MNRISSIIESLNINKSKTYMFGIASGVKEYLQDTLNNLGYYESKGYIGDEEDKPESIYQEGYVLEISPIGNSVRVHFFYRGDIIKTDKAIKDLAHKLSEDGMDYTLLQDGTNCAWSSGLEVFIKWVERR